MSKNSKSSRKVQTTPRLPLIDSRQTTRHAPGTAAGRYVQRRFGVRPEIADLIAGSAGLGGREER
jgi:hypothetical protein